MLLTETTFSLFPFWLFASVFGAFVWLGLVPAALARRLMFGTEISFGSIHGSIASSIRCALLLPLFIAALCS